MSKTTTRTTKSGKKLTVVSTTTPLAKAGADTPAPGFALAAPILPKLPPKPDYSHLPLLTRDDVPGTTLMRTLYEALSLRREHGSLTEGSFVAWLANRLPVTCIDAAGNIHCDRRNDHTNRTLFTSHTDTVHRSGGANSIRNHGRFWRACDAALGADDGAGVALMCHMIESGVPGYYIFFRGEECGGIGSSWLAKENPELLKLFDRAVAFDRAGYHDVITHQAGGRCCSDAFATALSDALTNDEFTLAYAPCDGGVYTDTAEFIRLVPECTNLSVGYKNQHGDMEEQDVDFLKLLADSLVTVAWDDLPTERDPKAAPKYNRYSRYGYGSYTSLGGTSNAAGRYTWEDDLDEEDWDDVLTKAREKYESVRTGGTVPSADPEGDDDTWDNYDPDTAIALAACKRWLDGTNASALVDLIAGYVYPDDPAFAKNNLNPHLLRDSDVEEAVGYLQAGWDPEGVMNDLYDCCRID